MKKIVDEKLKKQKDYLENTYLSVNGERTNFNLLDLSLSANVTPKRYYGELWNRVTTLQKYAEIIGYSAPVFMTITPRSENKPTKQIKLGKKGNIFKLVDNKNFDGQYDYVKQSLIYISDIWASFSRQRIFRDIKSKYGQNVIFMRTYEPHIDGSPHCHIVAFIPPDFLDRFVKVATEYFTESRFDIKTTFDDQKGGVVAYILKYILKSFENAIDGVLDTVAYWYAYYSIRRFTTSQTLIPLHIFRKINKHIFMQNLLKTTIAYKKGDFEIQKAYHALTCLYKDLTTLKNKDYFISKISILLPHGDSFSFNLLYEKASNVDFYVSKDIDKDSYKPFKGLIKEKKSIPVTIEGDFRTFVLKDGKIKQLTRSLNNFSHMDLLHYYKILNIETVDLHHYGLVQNECVRRHLIDNKVQNINDFSIEISTPLSLNPFLDDIKKALNYLYFYQLKYTKCKCTYNLVYNSMYKLV